MFGVPTQDIAAARHSSGDAINVIHKPPATVFNSNKIQHIPTYTWKKRDRQKYICKKPGRC